MEVTQLTRHLVDIPSVTGNEREVGQFLLDYLSDEGWSCQAQPVQSGRFNVVARRGDPNILLSTHMDTVPPFFPSSEDDVFVYGRGVCDAKGIIAAMICAARNLVAQGEDRLGLLFVVGEETDSVGAFKARELDLRCDFLVNGEPTDTDLVTGHKGVVMARLVTRGIAAHSAYPDQGESAIDKLLEVLASIQQIAFPVDEQLGPSFLNIGTIRGGRALNVIADEAEAEIMIRTVSDSQRYVELIQAAAGPAEVRILRTTEPQIMESIEGFSTKVVSYSTDIPALRPLGRPLLLGPGSILEAHTAKEKISKEQLHRAVELYEKLIVQLRKRISN